MKHLDRLHDDELHYLDSINRMTRQLHFHERMPAQHKPAQLQLTVEELEDELEAIRISQEKHARYR